MKLDRSILVMTVVMLGLLGAALAVIAVVRGGDHADSAAARSPVVSTPLEIPLKPAHHSGVTGTAVLTQVGANLQVTLKLSKTYRFSLPAHIHTGPCSQEPTFQNPRIWAGLNDVDDGRSQTTVDTVTLKELQSESASINVHDPPHNLRPLVCGDIPRAG
jgi:hypothetical protein